MLPTILANKGIFIVQTLHPCQVKANVDGWQQGSWQGFDNSFSDPAPWYFRTHDSWQTLFAKHGFSLIETKQPINPLNQTPASIIFIGQLTYDKDER